jgi:hypothetical protein
VSTLHFALAKEAYDEWGFDVDRFCYICMESTPGKEEPRTAVMSPDFKPNLRGEMCFNTWTIEFLVDTQTQEFFSPKTLEEGLRIVRDFCDGECKP